MHARPTVATIVTTNPIMIEFFLPNLSSIKPTNGEKMRAATSKDLFSNVKRVVYYFNYVIMKATLSSDSESCL